MKPQPTRTGCLSVPLGELFALGAGFYAGYRQAKGDASNHDYLFLATPPLLAATIGPLITRQAQRSSLWVMQKTMEAYHRGDLSYRGKDIKEYPQEHQENIHSRLEKEFDTLEEKIKDYDHLKAGARGAGLATLYTAAGYGLGYVIGTLG